MIIKRAVPGRVWSQVRSHTLKQDWAICEAQTRHVSAIHQLTLGAEAANLRFISPPTYAHTYRKSFQYGLLMMIDVFHSVWVPHSWLLEADASATQFDPERILS